MRKYLFLALGLGLMISAIGLREWLLLEEIEATKTQIKESMNESLSQAQSQERIRYLTTSNVAFERFLEPILEISNRLLWPASRSEAMVEASREIHALLDNLSSGRMTSLDESASAEIKKIKDESVPGLHRLYDILKMSENRALQTSCSETVRDEMKLMREVGQKKDEEILAALRVEGLKQIKQMEKNLKKMDAKAAGQYLTSGRFTREVAEPVLNLVLQIKQEELRKSAWSEFQRKLESSLSQKKFPIAKIKDRTPLASREIEKLFNSMAEAKAPELNIPSATPETLEPEAQPIYPEPSIPSAPSETGLMLEEEAPIDLRSPADADSN